MAVVFDRLDYVHDVFRRERTGDGLGTASVPDGREDFSVRVEVDMKALARMAGRAARNRGGVSVDGPLRVKVVSRSRTPA
jgi:hypothetical protein